MATMSEYESSDSVSASMSASASSLVTQGAVATKSSNDEGTSLKERIPFHWVVKPCFVYKEEYKDCKSFKARFHQYFVDGKLSECQQWKDDYDNCSLWEKNNNPEDLNKVIDSEKVRIRKRLRSHYANDVWEHRTSPPSDWNSELPESIKKDYKGSVLEQKQEELKNGTEKLRLFEAQDLEDGSSCSIM